MVVVLEAISGLSGPLFCDVGEQAARQSYAGTFGICRYQQERSALQSLQGEGGEREWEKRRWGGMACVGRETGKPAR